MRSQGLPVGAASFRRLKIGAGGFVTGIDMVGQTKVIRTDTYGGYRWDRNTSEWVQLVTYESMPSERWSPGGIYEICIAPSDPNIVYMVYDNTVFRSEDAGSSWVELKAPAFTADANSGQKIAGPFMAVDPVNPNVVYLGTMKLAGKGDVSLLRTQDGGVTWAAVTGLPQPTSDRAYVVAFGAPSEGGTATVIVACHGVGVYRSTDLGNTFALAAPDGPKKVHRIARGPDGALWLTETAKTVWRYYRDAWSSSVPGSATWYTVSVDPSDANRVVVTSDGGYMAVTRNAGASWYAPGNGKRVAHDIPWLAVTNENYMTAGDIAFDPEDPATLFFAMGIGVWKTTPPSSATAYSWLSQSAGIEQICVNWIVVPPGSKPIVLGWDRPAFRIEDPELYPTGHLFDYSQPIIMGWSGDYSPFDSNYVAVLCVWPGNDDSSFTEDGGQSWKYFGAGLTAALAGKFGGGIAVSEPGNVVVAPNNNGYPIYTLNGGATWKRCNFIGGAPANGQETGFGFAFYCPLQIVCSDAVTPKTFYLYSYIARENGGGAWRSTDGGANFERVALGRLYQFAGINTQLRRVPGKAGHVIFSPGKETSQRDIQSLRDENVLKRSTDGGVTWRGLPNVREVSCVGFGKAAPDRDYPACYIVGWVKTAREYTYGVWRSDDEFATWVSLGTWPLGSLDAIKCIEGDKDVYGKFYFGFSGSGAGYATYRYRMTLKWN